MLRCSLSLLWPIASLSAHRREYEMRTRVRSLLRFCAPHRYRVRCQFRRESNCLLRLIDRGSDLALRLPALTLNPEMNDNANAVRLAVFTVAIYISALTVGLRLLYYLAYVLAAVLVAAFIWSQLNKRGFQLRR